MDLSRIEEPKLSDSNGTVWELQSLECSICFNQMRMVGQALTDEGCMHDFCYDCLKTFVDGQKRQGKEPHCPVCQRNIKGVQLNRLASKMIQQFLHAQESLQKEQRRAAESARQFQTQLDESRELEQSATQVNNLLRQKLEKQKSRLEEQRAALDESRAQLEQQQQQRLQALEAANKHQAQLQQLATEKNAIIAKLTAALKQARQQSHNNEHRNNSDNKNNNDDDDDDNDTDHDALVDQRKFDEVSGRLNAYSGEADSRHDTHSKTSSTPTRASPALSPTASSATVAAAGSVLGVGSGLVGKLWEWARPSEPTVAGFTLDSKLFQIHERRGSRKNASVCRASVRATGEQVALKNVQQKARLREVMLLAKMRHRSLVHCDGVAFGTGQVCCAVLRPYAPFDLQYAFDAGKVARSQLGVVIRQLLDALAYLHSGDIVHCNIQAKTVLFTSEERVLLSCFTYAHSIRGSIATVPLKTAPISYFSPPEHLEEGSARKGSKAGDVWSVGVLAASLALSPTPLFAGTTAAALRHSMARFAALGGGDDGAALATTLAAALPDHTEFASFCLSMLKLNPHDRCTAEQALQHKFLRDQEAVRQLDLSPARKDDNVCELAYELTDDNIARFVSDYAPKLKRLL